MFLNQNNHVQFTLKLAKKAAHKTNKININELRYFSVFYITGIVFGHLFAVLCGKRCTVRVVNIMLGL
jgi:hypothetical protein